MKVKKYFLVASLFVFFLAFVALGSASFSIGNQSYQIQENYLQGSYLSGWLNMSFNETSTDKLFTDSLNNNATLQEILDLNGNYDYVCDTVNCESSYFAGGKALTKTFTLQKGESKIIGFKLKNQISQINSFSMSLQSNADSSCDNQVGVDFLIDGTIEASNNRSASNYCNIRYGGCFPTKNATSGGGTVIGITGDVITGNAITDPEEILLTNTPLCQKIKLPEAPKIGLGAWVREVDAGNRRVVMELFDLQGDFIDTCNLSKVNLDEGDPGIEIVCSTDYQIRQSKDYYICAHSEGTTGEYRTRGFIPENSSCGFIGYAPGTPTSAYDLFGQALNFNYVGTLEIGNELPDEETLSDMIEQYIIEKYGSLDCSDECLIPVKISSQKDQTITLSNIKLNYDKVGLGTIEEKYVYDFTEVYPKINSSYQKLFLDNLFLISGNGSLNYSLFFEGQNLIEQEIEIESIGMDINPTTAAAQVPTTFRIVISPPRTIINYEWDFGDGETTTTTKAFVEHTYEDIGNYELIVTAIKNDTSEEYTKMFNIEIKSPETIIPEKIENLRTNLEDLRAELNTFDYYTKQRLTTILNLDEKEGQLNDLENRSEIAESGEDFVLIAKELFALEIPNSIIINH